MFRYKKFIRASWTNVNKHNNFIPLCYKCDKKKSYVHVEWRDSILRSHICRSKTAQSRIRSCVLTGESFWEGRKFFCLESCVVMISKSWCIEYHTDYMIIYSSDTCFKMVKTENFRRILKHYYFKLCFFFTVKLKSTA